MILLLIFLNMTAQTNTSHIVLRGETLESIAKKYGKTVDDLQRLNPSTKKYVYAGMKLIIPPASNTSQSMQAQDQAPDDQTTNVSKAETTPIKKKMVHDAYSHRDMERHDYNSVGITIGHDFTDLVGITYGIQYQHFLKNGIGATFAVDANYGIEDYPDIVLKVGPSYVYHITNMFYATGTACYTLTFANYNGKTGKVSGASFIPAIGASFNTILVSVNGNFHWRNGGGIGVGAYLSVAYSF